MVRNVKRALALAAFVPLAVMPAACGESGRRTERAEAASADERAAASKASDEGERSYDCQALKKARDTLGFTYQLLYQFPTDDEGVMEQREAGVTIDVAEFRAAIDTLSVLEDAKIEQLFAPVAKVIARLREVADLVERAQATATPVADGVGVELRALVRKGFVGDQASINDTIDKVGC